MAFETNIHREDAGIQNSQIEEMFMLVATADQEKKYLDMLDKGYTGPATSYASSIIKRMFYYWYEKSVERGDDPMLQNELMGKRARK